MTAITIPIIIGNKHFHFSKKNSLFSIIKISQHACQFLNRQAINKFYTMNFRIVGFTILHFSNLEESNKQNELFNINPHLYFKVNRKYQNKIVECIIHTALIKSYDTSY